MKPGMKTSEFFLAAAGMVLAFLVNVGIVPNADAQSLNAAVSSVVSGVLAAVSLVSYLIQRYKLKTQPAPQVQPMRGPMTLPGEGCDQPNEELARLKAAREKMWADRQRGVAVAEIYPGNCDADS